jgi:predicted TIM-barrel enzyme
MTTDTVGAENNFMTTDTVGAENNFMATATVGAENNFMATDTVGAENKLTHLSFSTTGSISRRKTKDNMQCIRIHGRDLHLSC